MMELITDGEPAPEPSKLMNGIFWIIGSVCILGLVYGILQFIRQIFRDFRDSHDENGDRIEALEEPDKAAVIMPSGRAARRAKQKKSGADTARPFAGTERRCLRRTRRPLKLRSRQGWGTMSRCSSFTGTMKGCATEK